MEYSKNPIQLDPPPPAAEPAPAAHRGDAPTPAPAAPAAPAAPKAGPTASPASAASGPAPDLEARIVEALKKVYDPEIPVDVYELGLIYDIAIAGEEGEEERDVHVKMTLTSPACPVAGSLPGEVEDRVAGVAGVRQAEVEIVWDPTWNPSMMSEVAKLELGMF